MGIFKEHKRRVLVALSDIHSGHNLGLMNPSIALQRENEAGALTDYHPASTPFQEYLWKLYQENLKSVKDLAGKDEIIVIHNGDATHVNLLLTLGLYDRVINQERRSER